MRRILTYLLAIFCTVTVAAQNSISLNEENITIKKDAEKVMLIHLNTAELLASLQMNITLPESISIVGTPTVGEMANGAELKVKKYEGTNKYNIQILAESADGVLKEFTGTEGDILSFTVKGDGIVKGEFIEVTNVVGSTKDARKVDVYGTSATITVISAEANASVYAAESVSATKGEKAAVELHLAKTENTPLSSLQMNINLPAGVSLSGETATLGNMASDATLQVKKYEGTNSYNVQIVENNSNEFVGQDGGILIFSVSADTVLTDKIEITNIIGSTTDAARVDIDPISIIFKSTKSSEIKIDGKDVETHEEASSSDVDTSSITDEKTKEAIAENTTVSGVQLNSEATQEIVDNLKESESVSEEFKEALAAADEIEVKVTVQATPSVTTEGSDITYELQPSAVVTVGTGKTAQSATTTVTNAMIDQSKPISVTIYTGFEPTKIEHKDGETLLETFYNIATAQPSDNIFTYDEETMTATLVITHFSKLVATQNKIPTAITNVDSDAKANNGGKYVENGKVVIVKDGKKFTAAGAQMK